MSTPPLSPTTAALHDLFVTPPDDARPRAWWHWMDGNIDPDTVGVDLRWLHRVGVRGVQMFDGGMGGPCVVGAPVRPGSPAWADAVTAATRTARGLGMEFAVATSSGWSASGGPWVAPADAMRKVVWSQTVVSGTVDVALPPLPEASGPYQDAPRWGSDGAPHDARDAVVLAVPAAGGQVPLCPAAVAASHPLPANAGVHVTDGTFADGVTLPREPDAASEAWVELSFEEPVTVSSVVVGLPGPRGFGAAPAATAELQSVDEAGSVSTVAYLDVTAVPVRTASFAPVTARRFRLVLRGAPASDALPPLADGVRLPPVLRRVDTFTVTQFGLFAGSRVHQAEVKAGFGVVRDFDAVATPREASIGAIDPVDVHDVTRFVVDGRLRWDAPAGSWRIVRLGSSPTGQTNGPAPADTTGLEVDKLDGTRVAAYLDEYLTRTYGDEVAHIDALLSDSIEAGPQNWTDGILDRFRDLHGYDPTPWLLTLTGLLVGDAARSDAFLHDWRATIADLLATEYYGTLAREAHRRGMAYYAEALEDGRPQLGDDLAMRAHADVPMGAMWTFDPAHGPRPTYVADLRGAASVAHVHGKRHVGAEAFTSFESPWSSTPRTLKHVADLQLALGVTRFCIHTSPHQPAAAPPPGIALAPFLGQTFTRNETWAEDAGPWIAYLSRCAALLAAGEPDVQVLSFLGEEGPVTGLFDDGPDDAIPADYGVDYVDLAALEEVVRVEDGDLVTAGARYRALHLGGTTARMSVRALRAVARLVDAGATVIGVPPAGARSLADDPAVWDALRDQIWGSSGARTVMDDASHRGRALATPDIGKTLAQLGIVPPLRIGRADIRHISRVAEGVGLHFVANATSEATTADVTLTRPGRATAQLWDPVTGARRRVDTQLAAGGRRVSIPLAAFGSVFLVDDPHGREPQGAAATGPGVEKDEISLPLDGPWSLALPDGREIDIADPIPWTQAELRGFSGTAVYRTRIDLDTLDQSSRATLEFADIHDLATVSVNGIECGTLWTAPWRLDVSDAVQPGLNEIEVAVTNPWRNRLIAAARGATDGIFAPMTQVFEPDAEPLPAGPRGPVTLRLETRDRADHPG